MELPVRHELDLWETSWPDWWTMKMSDYGSYVEGMIWLSLRWWFNIAPVSIADNRELPWCQFCRHWWYRRLSSRQPAVPPVTQIWHHGDCQLSVAVWRGSTLWLQMPWHKIGVRPSTSTILTRVNNTITSEISYCVTYEKRLAGIKWAWGRKSVEVFISGAAD